MINQERLKELGHKSYQEFAAAIEAKLRELNTKG